MSTESCNQDVYKYGESVGIFNMTKDEAEAFCKEQTDLSGDLYDWHFTMGRVHVMVLKAGVKEKALLIDAAKDLYDACAEFVRKVDCGQARSTQSYKQMKSALSKADGELNETNI